MRVDVIIIKIKNIVFYNDTSAVKFFATCQQRQAMLSSLSKRCVHCYKTNSYQFQEINLVGFSIDFFIDQNIIGLGLYVKYKHIFFRS